MAFATYMLHRPEGQCVLFQKASLYTVLRVCNAGLFTSILQEKPVRTTFIIGKGDFILCLLMLMLMLMDTRTLLMISQSVCWNACAV